MEQSILRAGQTTIPAKNFPSFVDVQLEAKQRATAVFAIWTSLFELLERYEAVVRQRWLKKSAQQRRKTLLAVSPKMPEMHRPDFGALRNEGQEQRKAGTRYFQEFVLPSINVEDLIMPKNLLLFMHSRGRTKPDAFVKADLLSFHTAFIVDALVPTYLSGYTMLLIGQKDADKYGRLVAWNDDPEAYDWMDRGIGHQPGEGLLILQVQGLKLSFLLNCAKNILHDLPLQDTSIPTQPAPPPVRLGSEDSEWPSLRKELLEAPYRLPDQFDFARLRILISAKRGEAEDRIWSLREDPAYFKEFVLDWAEHRHEQISSSDNKPHPEVWERKFWERVLSSLISEVYCSLIEWHLLEKDIQYLAFLRDQFSNSVKRKDADLPRLYGNALSNFSYFAEKITRGALRLWNLSMVSSPGFRMHFERALQDSNNPDKGQKRGDGNSGNGNNNPDDPAENDRYNLEDPNKYRIRGNGKAENGRDDLGNPNKCQINSRETPENEKDYFLWLVGRLTMEGQTFLCGLENVVDEIERMARSDPKCHERLSSWLAEVLSDLSVLAEIQHQVDLFPQVVPPHGQQAEFEKKTQLLTKVYCYLPNIKVLTPGEIPLCYYNYPSDRRRTPAVIHRMLEAEQNLDWFWTTVDDDFAYRSGQYLHDLLFEMLREREIRRTEYWEESEDQNVDSLTHQMSTSGLEGAPKAVAEHPLPSTNPIHTVSKRGYKVFSTLFFDPSAAEEDEEFPGEIPWSDFLSAMRSIGFSVKSLHGSAWLFTLTADPLERSMIFHEPHPSSKISLHTARRYGRRLEWNFGWTKGSFARG